MEPINTNNGNRNKTIVMGSLLFKLPIKLGPHLIYF